MHRFPANFLALTILVFTPLLTAACTLTPPNLPAAPTSTIIVIPTQTVKAATSVPATAAPPVPTAVVLPTGTIPPTALETPAQNNGGNGSADDLNTITQRIANAIGSQDYTAMRALMRPRFSIVTFNQSLYEYSSDEAINQMRATLFAAGSDPVIDQTTDVVALLGGADPLAQWGPVAQVVRAVHMTSLGADAAGEAVFVIGREPETGKLYWHGILLPQNGHTFQNVQPGTDVVPTDVKYIVAREEVNVRTGPGTQYAVEGKLRQGEIAQVEAVTPDGAWWWIVCTQDSSGHCWVTADPTLTQPTTKP